MRLEFEPLFPPVATAANPNSLVDVMWRVGFDLRPEHEDPGFELHTEAVFALAEQLTGVRLTPELLGSATFLCATAALPGDGAG